MRVTPPSSDLWMIQTVQEIIQAIKVMPCNVGTSVTEPDDLVNPNKLIVRPPIWSWQVAEAYIVKHGQFSVFFRGRLVGTLKPGSSFLEKGLLDGEIRAGIGCKVGMPQC